MRQLSFPTLQRRGERRAGGALRSASRGVEAGNIPRPVVVNPPPPRRTRRAHLKRRLPRPLERMVRLPTLVASLAAALAVLVGGVSVMLAGGIGTIASTAESRLIDWSASLGIAVREVLVEGRRETGADAILAALDVGPGTPLLAFSPEAARARLLALGWVRDARIERRLPGTIYVGLVERRPAAIWQNRGSFTLVDASGAVIGDEALERYADLRVIVGAQAPETFADLFAILDAEPFLASRVVAAVRVGGRRWNVQLDRGLTVLLPETGAADAWAVLAQIARNQALLEREIAQIDLRSRDRLTVRLLPRPGPAGDGRGA